MRICFLFLLFSAVLCVEAQVEIYGRASNYTDTVFYISETGGFHNFTRLWRDNRVKITIDKSGQFRASVPEEAIGAWYIKTGKDDIQVFDLVKGRRLELKADFSKRYPLQAVGKNAADFNYSSYINERIHRYYEKENYLQKVRQKNIDSVIARRKAFSDFKLKTLEEYRRAQAMSEPYYRWLRSKYTYEPYERTVVENIKRDSLDDSTVSKIMEKGVDDAYAALNTVEYNDLVDFYVAFHIEKNYGREMTLHDRFAVVANGNLLTGNTKDAYLSRFVAWSAGQPDSVYGTLFGRYDQIVRNEKMKQAVAARRNEYRNRVAASVVASDSNAASLNEIFRKYRGKVIYLDFWASWCVPCRAEMPNASILRKNLQGKDIVFLYFGYNDKEQAWLKAREQLGVEGEHYLLDEKLMKEADALFGINGIPHYAIINKKGSIVNRRADRPRDVYSELLQLLQE